MKDARETPETTVRLTVGDAALEGNLSLSEEPMGMVLFAHGSGSSRHSVRNRFVASALREANFGTLLFDLLSPEEEAIDLRTTRLRFDVAFLAQRLLEAMKWLRQNDETKHLSLGLFGSSTGAAAALMAAAYRPVEVAAVVSRGGRPDLAEEALKDVRAPTLLIVGGNDGQVVELNRLALDQLNCEKKLEIIPRATHLFEEPGALKQVAGLASEWFAAHIANG